tara:strand:- start:450 stop:842 length:393 start_codon:yes stop_codon:yes gene_type:complete
MGKMDDIVCLDTTELIDIMKGKSEKELLKNKTLITTQINAFELACGGENERDIKIIEDLIYSLPKKTIKTEDALLAGKITRELRHKGLDLGPKGPRDLLIGSICINRKIPLITRNKKHFERFQDYGLKLV